MKVGRVQSKVFIEGIEVTQFTNYTLYCGKEESPTLQIVYPASKNIRKLLPSTIIQLFIKDSAESDDWFLLFDGYLINKTFYKAEASENVTLIFKGFNNLFTHYRYTNYDITSPVTGISSDILMANLGIKSNSEATIPFRDPTGTLGSRNLLSLEKWNELKTKGDLGGFPKLIESLLYGTTLNTPALKIMQDSMKMIERFKIFDSDKLFELATNVEGFLQLNKDIIQSNTSQPYKSILNKVCGLGLARIIELGIPVWDNVKNSVVSTIVIQPNEYASPPIFNVIFPDEFSNYQLNFDYEAEPTRAMNSSFSTELGSPIGLFNGAEMKGSILPTFFAPVKELLITPEKGEGGKVKYRLKFTEEEKYRGVNPMVIRSTPYEYAYASFYVGPQNSSENSALRHVLFTEEELKKNADKLLKEDGKKDDTYTNNLGFFERMLYVTEMKYLTTRLAARGIGQIQVPYFNPNWLMGFPGLIITPIHGPILVTFDSFVVQVNYEGTCSSNLTVSSPRFLDDYISMDEDPPKWYEDYYFHSNIGKSLYNNFSAHGTTLFKDKGSSVLDFTKTYEDRYEKPIEEAAKKLWKGEKYIPYESRRKNFVTASDYFKFLKVKTNAVTKFPNPGDTEYRQAKDLDAYTIAFIARDDAGPIEWLECPYVYERGIKVLEWLGLEDITLKIGTKFKVPDKITADILVNDIDGPVLSFADLADLPKSKIFQQTSAPTQKSIIESRNLKDYILEAKDFSTSPNNVETEARKLLTTKMKKRYNLIEQDLLQAGGNPEGNKEIYVWLSKDLLECLTSLPQNFGKNWRIFNLITSHNFYSNKEKKKVSYHAAGKAVDLVGVDNKGNPSISVTSKLATHLRSRKTEYSIRWIGWDESSKSDEDHSPKSDYGMHIHIDFY